MNSTDIELQLNRFGALTKNTNNKNHPFHAFVLKSELDYLNSYMHVHIHSMSILNLCTAGISRRHENQMTIIQLNKSRFDQ